MNWWIYLVQSHKDLCFQKQTHERWKTWPLTFQNCPVTCRTLLCKGVLYRWKQLERLSVTMSWTVRSCTLLQVTWTWRTDTSQPTRSLNKSPTFSKPCFFLGFPWPWTHRSKFRNSKKLQVCGLSSMIEGKEPGYSSSLFTMSFTASMSSSPPLTF